MMSVVGLGTDLSEIKRFRRFVKLEKTALLERLFTKSELNYALEKKDPAPHLAARFAAKESCLKALGTGWRYGINWHDIEIVQDQLGRPSLQFAGRVLQIANEKQVQMVHLSYSHEGDYAVAIVVLES
jgi:holo-[acyl-carrier protein] synthase